MRDRKKSVQMRVLKGRGEEGEECPEGVRRAVEGITQKMGQCKLAELHPPFLPKTITKFRHEYFLPLKPLALPSPSDLLPLRTLRSFILALDCQYLDLYLEQVREPYIRKMFNENYEFDRIDFKEINSEYKIRSETENLLSCASEWLVQIEKTQDLLERVELYFDIRTPMIIERAKKEGVELGGRRTWSESVSSALRNVCSYTLRKSSKIIQSSFFTTIAPAAAMLTLAIISGNSALSWQPASNSKFLLAPIIAITVPYFLDGLASTIQRKEYMQMLEEWAITLEEVSDSIAKFNEEVEETILLCASAQEYPQYERERLNLQKLVKTLGGNIRTLSTFQQSRFDEMRQRTQAYFKGYTALREGEWTVVLPQQQPPSSLP